MNTVWQAGARRPRQHSRHQYTPVNPLMYKVAKIVTKNNAVRRHTGLTHGFWPTVLSVEPMVQYVVCLSVVCRL